MYAGVIIDLKRDTIILYYSDKLNNTKIKHTLFIKDYKTFLQSESRSNSLSSPFDNTFTILQNSRPMRQVKDSVKILGSDTDYSLYNDSSGYFKSETFDTKALKIEREILEMAFMNIPEGINFSLKSEIK